MPVFPESPCPAIAGLAGFPWLFRVVQKVRHFITHLNSCVCTDSSCAPETPSWWQFMIPLICLLISTEMSSSSEIWAKFGTDFAPQSSLHCTASAVRWDGTGTDALLGRPTGAFKLSKSLREGGFHATGEGFPSNTFFFFWEASALLLSLLLISDELSVFPIFRRWHRMVQSSVKDLNLSSCLTLQRLLPEVRFDPWAIETAGKSALTSVDKGL